MPMALAQMVRMFVVLKLVGEMEMDRMVVIRAQDMVD